MHSNLEFYQIHNVAAIGGLGTLVCSVAVVALCLRTASVGGIRAIDVGFAVVQRQFAGRMVNARCALQGFLPEKLSIQCVIALQAGCAAEMSRRLGPWRGVGKSAAYGVLSTRCSPSIKLRTISGATR